ncbi:MAG: hypothetical protein WAV90_15775 [Gordonia amarae]
MSLTIADIDRWDAGDVREIFHIVTTVAQASADAANGIATLPVLASWGGDVADAARTSGAKIVIDLNSLEANARIVGAEARAAATAIDGIKNDLRTLRTELQALGLTLNPVTGKIEVGPKLTANPTELIFRMVGLQQRVDDLLARADTVDASLADALERATGVKGPADPQPEKTPPQVQATGNSIEVGDDAINSESPILPPHLNANDPEFATKPGNALEGTLARGAGESAAAYLRARGWGTAADLIDHYLSNQDGGRDPSFAKPFQLSTPYTDGLAEQPSGYTDVPGLPTLLGNARTSALAAAAQSGQGVYTEVYGAQSSKTKPGWNVVGTSNPGDVYALGRYSVQVVTQVDATGTDGPVVRQRYYVYDLTDFAHPDGIVSGGPVDTAKNLAIDQLAKLRDMGWARVFDTRGTSSVKTYPQ